jgi:molecular chaperone DnaK
MDQPSSTESNAITLRIRFKSASLDEFIGRYGADVSPGGLFIRTKQPVEVGTSLQFDFSLADGSPLLSGMGTVAWVRESDPARANNVPGMGLRFDKLTAESQHTHQLILAEKARKEGKASATPYPPTAFVAAPARVSPAPEGSKPGEALPRVEPGPAVSAITRPAPATAMKPATPSPAARPVASPLSGIVQSAVNFSDTDEFSEAGKTEVSEKPLDYYLKEAEAAKADHGRRQESKTAEEAVPQSLLDEVSTGSPVAPITRSGPPPEGFAAEEPAPDAAGLGDAKPVADDGQRGGLGAPIDFGGESEADAVAVPSGEIMPELSAGAPIEETPPEKTEEVAAESASLPLGDAEPLRGPEPLDLGTGREINFGDERPPGRDAVPTLRRKSGSGTIALVAVAAAAAAFAVVYLAKARPWQSRSHDDREAHGPGICRGCQTPARCRACGRATKANRGCQAGTRRKARA